MTAIDELKKARSDFFNNTGHPERVIRQEILDSWNRSRTFGVNVENARRNILSPQELQKRIAQQKTLYDISSSFIDYLYRFVKGSGFMLMFAGADGYILKIIGDMDIIYTATHQEIPLVQGCCRSEASMGTNAVGTPLVTGEPIQLLSYEHYFELSANWTCSGAPILLNGRILGVICLSGDWENAHLHSLGMVMSAAEAISRQMNLMDANTRLATLHSQLQTSIDAVRSCILLVDASHKILTVNAMTARTLARSEEELLSQNYRNFFPDLNLDEIRENLFDAETTMRGKNESYDGYVSVRLIRKQDAQSEDPTDNGHSFLISFRKNEYVKRLVNRVIGSDAHFTFDDIIGQCPQITELRRAGLRAARSNANILILGESGTGKELFAQSIHNASQNAGGPFVAINCGAIPRDLIESELFGYEAGAFTGAKKEGRAGKFELANNGTVFLDEIGDMPLDVQVRLLRVLQNRAVTRIGGKKSVALNVRVIAATNKDLEQEVENHTFRADLFYRLNVFTLNIPPLRERKGDAILLAQYFLQRYQNLEEQLPIASISPEAREMLERYAWPGNIRELENTIERACILCSTGVLSPEHLPSSVRGSEQETAPKAAAAPAARAETLPAPEQPADHLSVQEAERLLILEHLRSAGGNARKAAETLGISRQTLYRKFEKYRINPNEIRYLASRP